MTDLINAIDTSLSFNQDTIRVLGTIDKPLFVVKDICKILGISNSTDILKNIPSRWKDLIKSNTSRGLQTVNVVTEPGLYKIIMRSNKPKASILQEWICENILPSIRKNGEYKMNKEYQEILQQNQELLKQNEEHDKELKKMNIILKRRERKKYKKKHCVYVLTNPDIKDSFKIGETHDLTARVGGYTTGAPKPYDVRHHRSVRFKSNQKSVEDLLLTILDQYRVTSDIKGSRKREWVENIDFDTIQLEMDGLVDYINGRISEHDPDYSIDDVKSDKIIEPVSTTREDTKVDEKDNDVNTPKDPTKICIVCNVEKHVDAYYDRFENVDGKEGRCKICYAAWKKELKLKRQPVIPKNIKTKPCRKCKETLDLEYFSPHGTSRDGYSYICKNCIFTPPLVRTEKKCGMCKVIKPVSEYNNCRTASDGKSCYCRPCGKLKSAKYREKRKGNPPPTDTSKVCSNCHEDKSITCFWDKPMSKDGKDSHCSDCKNQARKDRKEQKIK